MLVSAFRLMGVDSGRAKLETYFKLSVSEQVRVTACVNSHMQVETHATSMAITAAGAAVSEVSWFSNPAVKVCNGLCHVDQDMIISSQSKCPTA